MDFLKSTVKQEIFSTALYLLLGIFFVVKPDLALSTIAMVISIGTLIIGVAKIALYFREKTYEGIQQNGLVSGLVITFVALYFLIRSEVLGSLIGFLLGFIIILAGITQFQSALDLKHFHVNTWLATLISSIIMIILGIISLLFPFATEKALIFVSGIFILVCAVFKIASILLLMYGTHLVKRTVAEANAMDVTDSAVIVPESSSSASERGKENQN